MKLKTRKKDVGDGKKKFISYDKETKRIQIGKKRIKRRTFLIIAIVLTLIIGGCTAMAVKKSKSKPEMTFVTANVERRDMENTISSSSTLEANDTYDVTALVTGEILTDTFNEGDTVKKDDVLYTIESTTAQNGVKTAQNALSKAQNSYNEAADSAGNLSVKSNYSGKISKVYVKTGDMVQNGGAVADVYDDSTMKLRLPFNENDANSIYRGESAKIKVAGSSDTLWGTVTEVSGATVATSNHAIVKYVTITVTNPGALTSSDKATAEVGNVVCSDIGTFEYITSGTITAKTSGKVAAVNVSDNDIVYYNQTVVQLTSENIENTLKNARLSLDDAKISLEKAQKTLEDYTIKAPISGTVIVKNKKAGDKLDNSSGGSSAMSSSSSSSSAMAVIYDMSSLKIQLSIDETEIQDVQVGQSVSITADAVPGKTFSGTVEKVGVDGTSSNGVTTYPVKVVVTDFGELLPGMNVNTEIVVSRAENVLAVPLGAVNRGNIVYVKGEKTDDKDKAPDGYRSAEVETGINDDSYIEIKSGLDEGEEIRAGMVATGNDTSGSVENQQMVVMPGGDGGGMPGGGGPGGGMR